MEDPTPNEKSKNLFPFRPKHTILKRFNSVPDTLIIDIAFNHIGAFSGS